MTGPTHRQYSICFALVTAMLFFKLDITAVNYYIALPVLIMTAKAGALFPDVDHDWRNVHDKTIINRIINFLIHITGGRHRSWQTHSWDICLWFTVGAYFIPIRIFRDGILTNVNSEILQLLLLGFASGWISHLIADMFTSAGVRVLCFLNKKVAFVPKKLGPIVFKTGASWEMFNYKFMRVVNVILGCLCLIYPAVYDKI